MPQDLIIDCDGEVHRISIDDGSMPLLYVLTDILGLKNPRYGCGLGQCGSCTVHIDGVPARSCLTPATAAAGRKIQTIAGLGTPENPHPLQAAFIEEQATQCGYCINGWLMTAAAILRDKPGASRTDLKEGLSGLKCRCGTHMSIMRAIERAAGIS